MTQLESHLQANSVSRSSPSEHLIWLLLLARLLVGVILAWLPSPVIRAFSLYAYLIATHLLTALLIWRERERLPDYRISRLAVIFFLAAVPYQIILTLLGLAHSFLPATLFMLPISIWLLVALLKSRDARLTTSPSLLLWLGVGIVVGAASGVICGFLLTLQTASHIAPRPLLEMLLLPTIQLANAAVQEEPLFRGFLWGLLEKKGWPGLWIWLFQAALFWLGHIYYLRSDPYSLWIIVPFMGLILGLVAWKARDIAPSMVTHAFANGIGQIIARV